MTLSRRIERIQAPVIPDVTALLAENPGAISLGQGVPAYGPPLDILRAATEAEIDPGRHRYQPGDGMAELLDAWRANLTRENAIAADDGLMMVTAGSNMAFLHLMAVIADPGDQVILPAPYFFNQRMALETLSIEPVLVPTNGEYQLEPERIAAAITPRSRAIVTISPNNPTGAVYSREALTAVNALCAKHGLLHVSDEAYQHFVFDGAEHFSPASLPGASEHTASLFSMSKSYGMAGWRTGCLVGPRRLANNLRKVHDTNLICAPVPSQRLAAGLLANGEGWRNREVAKLGALRELVIAGLAGAESPAEVPVTQGAFYFLLRLPGTGADMPVVERLVREFGVALVPGSAFGAGPRIHLRLAYGALTDSNLTEAIRRLRAGLISVCAAEAG